MSGATNMTYSAHGELRLKVESLDFVGPVEPPVVGSLLSTATRQAGVLRQAQDERKNKAEYLKAGCTHA